MLRASLFEQETRGKKTTDYFQSERRTKSSGGNRPFRLLVSGKTKGFITEERGSLT